MFSEIAILEVGIPKENSNNQNCIRKILQNKNPLFTAGFS